MLLHEPHPVISGSVCACANIETVGRNNSDAAEDDRGRQVNEVTDKAAVRASRGLQHIRASSAARPGYAQIVAFARQLRDVEERPAIMWISPGQNLFDGHIRYHHRCRSPPTEYISKTRRCCRWGQSPWRWRRRGDRYQVAVNSRTDGSCWWH